VMCPTNWRHRLTRERDISGVLVRSKFTDVPLAR
jgi:hypothetical protein